jgi:hypothetical protein
VKAFLYSEFVSDLIIDNSVDVLSSEASHLCPGITHSLPPLGHSLMQSLASDWLIWWVVMDCQGQHLMLCSLCSALWSPHSDGSTVYCFTVHCYSLLAILAPMHNPSLLPPAWTVYPTVYIITIYIFTVHI